MNPKWRTTVLVLLGVLCKALAAIPAVSEKVPGLATLDDVTLGKLLDSFAIIFGLFAVTTAKGGIHKHITEATGQPYSKDNTTTPAPVVPDDASKRI